MEYSEDFRLVQTALGHCNEYVKKFDKINYYSGNEIYINEIALKLRNIFLSKRYDFDESHELRKINFLLMLNTDSVYKFNLSEDLKICHLLNNFPQLSKCLYINLVWHLKIEKYFYEAIKYSPSWFMLQFLEETIDSLRFSKSFDVIHQVRNITEAIYINICRTDYRSSKGTDHIDQKIRLTKLIDIITSLLRHYNTPVTEESLTKSKKKMREYAGRSLDNQISLIFSCFKMIQEKPSFAIDEKFHIYKLNLENEPEINNYSSKKYSLPVQEALMEINVILLNTLQNSILNITLDDFMYWVEIDIEDKTINDEDLKRDNLQKLIGEQAYELLETINTNPHFEHNVTNQLSTIAIRPKTLIEVAKEAGVGTILEKIETSHSRVVWLEELLNRPNTLYFNNECLQTIIDNIDIVRIEHLTKMLREHQNFESMDIEDENQMNEIFLKGGAQLDIDQKRNFIEEMIQVLQR